MEKLATVVFVCFQMWGLDTLFVNVVLLCYIYLFQNIGMHFQALPGSLAMSSYPCTEALKSSWTFCGTLINDCHSFKEWTMLFLSLFFFSLFFLASTLSFKSLEFLTLARQESFLWQTYVIPVMNYRGWHYWRAVDALRALRSFDESALMLAIRYTWCSQIGLPSLKSLAKHLWFPTESGNRENLWKMPIT